MRGLVPSAGPSGAVGRPDVGEPFSIRRRPRRSGLLYNAKKLLVDGSRPRSLVSARSAEPDDEGRDGGGAVDDVAAFVVESGDRSGLLQSVDRRLDGVALLVALIEAGRPSTGCALARAGRLAVGFLRDGVAGIPRRRPSSRLCGPLSRPREVPARLSGLTGQITGCGSWDRGHGGGERMGPLWICRACRTSPLPAGPWVDERPASGDGAGRSACGPVVPTSWTATGCC